MHRLRAFSITVVTAAWVAVSSPPASAKSPPAGRVLGYITGIPRESPETRIARHDLVARRRAGTPIIVHRGAWNAAPENTLEAYAAAMDQGADGCEIDPRRTRDGVIYLYHDDQLGRVLQGSGRLADKTYYEILIAPLKQYGDASGDTRVPTLAAFLTVARQRAMLIHFDVKEPGLQSEIEKMLDQADMWDQVVEVNPWNAELLRSHPKVKRLAYKGHWPEGKDADNPAAIADFLARPGQMIFCDDPRPAVRGLKREVSQAVPLPPEVRARWGVNGIVADGADAGTPLRSPLAKVGQAPAESMPAPRPFPPAELRCEYRPNPLGLGTRNPRLSWQVNDDRRGAVQTAYHVIVSTDPAFAKAEAVVWDTGKIKSGQSIHLVYAGRPVKGATRYYWKVRTWDGQEQPSGWSEPAWWEMGLWGVGNPSAEWIAADDPSKEAKEAAGPRRSICMRRELPLKAKPVRARIYASGLGIYELHVNGQKAGPDVFAPGWTYYPKHIQYQTYDVTPLLRQGDNVVGVILGNGWWFGGMAATPGAASTKEPLRFICQIDVEYADGSTDRVVTDRYGYYWKASPSPITRNTFYHGEAYDARLEQPGWDSPGFDAGKWWNTIATGDATDTLVAQESEPILVTQELPAVEVSEPQKGVYIYDFGQNAAGRCRLKVKGPAGTQVRLRFGEVLTPDGKLYRDNYRGAQATDEYILKGEGEEVWEPRFTYRGFRYCELTGYPGTPGRAPPKGALVCCVVHSAPEWIGSFECSNFLINRIYECIRWGQRSNLHSVPTDCPQRDERLGWMGDAQAFAWTGGLNMNMAPFLAKWMRDVIDSQAGDGHVTDVSPMTTPKAGPAAPGWGDAVVIVPWTVWRLYGDTRLIEQNYAGMAAWVEYMGKNAPNHLYEREGYGDWVASVESPKKPIGAAYYYYSTKLLSEMAAAVGKSEDAKRYSELASEIAEAFNRKYLDGSNNYPGATQTANILPLAFGITPEDRRAGVLANIANDIAARGNHLSTGFMGTAYLLPLLAANGRQDLACAVATQTTWPSWGYMVLNGATTIWELWDADHKGPDMNSRNHFAFGTVGRWFYESLAGIQADPASPGFKHFHLHPQPAGDLTWARGEFKSMYGPIRSEWRRTDPGLILKIAIPANTSATVYVPTLGSQEPTISETGKVLLKAGKPQEESAGIKFVRMDADAAVFEVGAGEYAMNLRGE